MAQQVQALGTQPGYLSLIPGTLVKVEVIPKLFSDLHTDTIAHHPSSCTHTQMSVLVQRLEGYLQEEALFFYYVGLSY